jgi:hypothetical protein
MENMKGTLITDTGRIMEIEISSNFQILHLGDIPKPITIFEMEEAEILEADLKDDLEDIRFMGD